jgi:glucose-1-phosphate thymidylyltransferase
MSALITHRSAASHREMWGIIPAAGAASRMQPLAVSKELLPVGSHTEDGVERPRAVSEYLVDRLIRAGARKLCFVISPSKADIVQYYGSRPCAAEIVYAVQPHPLGLCDAIFRAAPLIREEQSVAIGLPDTVWFPEDALSELPVDELSFLLFPTDRPEHFDAVVTDSKGAVLEIQVKHQQPRSNWIWGALAMPGRIFHALHALWLAPHRRDEYLGTLVNAWLSRGGAASGVRAGREYVDAGTLEGYRDAIQLLRAQNGASRPIIRPPSGRQEGQTHVFGSFSR